MSYDLVCRMTPSWAIRQGDSLDLLRAMPAESVQSCITSPPYFGLRDYDLPPSTWGDGWVGCLGLEPTPDQFVAHLVEVFAEVRRVLRPDGTLWVNMGDSYAGSWGAQSRTKGVPRSENASLGHGSSSLQGRPQTVGAISALSRTQIAAHPRSTRTGSIPAGAPYKPKDLFGIPWMLAFALRADGWYLRSDIIWHKPNPMPESVTDRPTSSHEHLFLLSKQSVYLYDAEAIREADCGSDHPRSVLSGQVSLEPSNGLRAPHRGLRKAEGRNGMGRNKRNVWIVASQPYTEAHFATFPPKLIEPCILAGSAEKACGECGAPWQRVTERTAMVTRAGPTRQARRDAASGAESRRATSGTMLEPPTNVTVGFKSSCDHDDGSGRSLILDPFAGAGTMGLVALRHGRSFLGLELSPVFVEMARERVRRDSPLFNVERDPTDERTQFRCVVDDLDDRT